MNSIKLYANAKINLFLDIESKREDGYHNITSLMQSVDLCDTVTVSYTDSDIKKIEIEVDDSKIPVGEKNIAYKAADRLLERGYVKIKIEKKIPSPAGLAGGSADAAAVIYALTRLTQVDKTDDEIMKIASGIGADVPFCLVGGSKRISGIGDVIEDVTPFPEMNLLIAISGEGVSTPAAYALLDEKYRDFYGYKPRTVDFNNFSLDNVYNVFEDVVLNLRPEAMALRDKMYKLGARTVFMSGSGPAIVGIFGTDQSARAAAEKLGACGCFAVSCKTAKEGISEDM